MKTIIEPFKIKSVEPIKFTTVEEREEVLKKGGYNLFMVPAEDVLIDLLTDSGTSAMSADQWAGIMRGDESYAGARSFYRFFDKVQELTGFKNIIPTHQGRAAEKILFSIVGRPGKFVPNNAHFDTTRANVEFSGAVAVDCPRPRATIPTARRFQGEHEHRGARGVHRENRREKYPAVHDHRDEQLAGRPAGLDAEHPRNEGNLPRARHPAFLGRLPLRRKRLFHQTARAGLRRPLGAEHRAGDVFLRRGCTMSAKKDGIVNIGGFVAMNDDQLAVQARNLLIITEGFPTYGGLAGRDLEAIAIGLEEVLDENYLHYRIRSTAYLGERVAREGVPILQPPGGHAIYLNAKKFLPHVPVDQYPGQALSVELYRWAGIRSVEIGSVMFGKYDAAGKLIPASMELVRLAIPRRVYTQSHIDYVIEAIVEVFQNRDKLRGYRIVEEPPMLRHFTARFAPIG